MYISLIKRAMIHFGTPLDSLLRERSINQVEIVGVCTDICVLHTAISAYNLGYKISVPAEGVASFNQKGHEWALAHFKNSLGAEVEQHVLIVAKIIIKNTIYKGDI